MKIKGKWHYLYRAIDKDGNTLDWMLSNQRNKKAAKRFFKKLLGNKHTVDPRVINVDKSQMFPPALRELQAANDAPSNTELRAVKYLNNRMENDHKFTKSKSRYRQWYQLFSTARNTLDVVWNPCVLFRKAKCATLEKTLRSRIVSSAVCSE